MLGFWIRSGLNAIIYQKLLSLQGACTTNIGHVMATPGNSVVLKLLDHNLRRPAKSTKYCFCLPVFGIGLRTCAGSIPVQQAVLRELKANKFPRPSVCMLVACPTTTTKLSSNSPDINWYITPQKTQKHCSNQPNTVVCFYSGQ